MSKERKIKRSYVWAGLFAAAIVLWVASGSIPRWIGNLNGSETPAVDEAVPELEVETLFRVEVTRFNARPKPSELLVRGRTEASRRVEVRARTQGIVEVVAVEEGAMVAEGDLLCKLDDGARSSQLAEERARLASAEIEFEAADRLAEQQFASETRRALEQAELDAARAAVERMEQEVSYTAVTAPIDGVIERREAELGSFLQVGGLCATIIDLDPMLVVVHVGERNIAALNVGMVAAAQLVTGERIDGTVSFISPAADETTRTFRVEVEFANEDLALRDGVTAELMAELPSANAHFLPASTLTLNDAGEIGVRVLDAENTVQFRKVTILSDLRDGVWIAGLEDTVDVITVGQDFVLEGQVVEPVFAQAEPIQ
jgi:multidrug efflux system membrane fusion protein